jgi:hypothetical protein
MDRVQLGKIILNEMRKIYEDLELTFLNKLEQTPNTNGKYWSSEIHHLPALQYYSNLLDIIVNNKSIQTIPLLAKQTQEVLPKHRQKLWNQIQRNNTKSKIYRMRTLRAFDNIKSTLNSIKNGSYTRKQMNRNHFNTDPTSPKTPPPTEE